VPWQLSGYGRSDWSTKLTRGLSTEAVAGFQSRRALRHDAAPSLLNMLLSRHTKRREFLTLVGGAAASWPHAVSAQEPPRPLRIGTVSLNTRNSPQRAAFEQRLRELGYIEGQNIIIEYINTPDLPDRIDEAARELVQRKIDVFVLENQITLKSVMNATSTSPIVIIATNFDPVALGVLASIARPGGNVTGFYVRRPELVEKQIGLLAETFPGKNRLGVLWDAVSAEAFPAAERTAIALSWGLEPLKLERPPYDFVPAFRSLAQRGVQMILILHSGLFTEDRAHVAALALQHGLPSMFTDKIYADAGGLMSYGPDLAMAHRRAADYVDRIAKGAKPADLPIEQPARFILTLNLKTARALGVELPATMLARADEVIE
jgi:putative ABC transport system substrate-binding protein